MSILFNTQTKLVPDFYYDNKVGFFKNCLKGPQYLCDLINSGLEIAYQGDLLQERLIFNENDFSVFDIDFSPTERILFIDLPLTEKTQNSNIAYLKTYCIPYLQNKNNIKILDLYALQPIPDTVNENIIKFYRNSDFEICFDTKLCKQYTFDNLYRIIFKKDIC